jgi:CBS domain-containing protein
VENGKLVGMVSLIDFMRKIQNATLDDNEPVYNEMIVSDIMTKSPLSLPSNTPIEDVAKELAKGVVHAYVVADNNEVCGIVSTADIINFLLNN